MKKIICFIICGFIILNIAILIYASFLSSTQINDDEQIIYQKDGKNLVMPSDISKKAEEIKKRFSDLSGIEFELSFTNQINDIDVGETYFFQYVPVDENEYYVFIIGFDVKTHYVDDISIQISMKSDEGIDKQQERQNIFSEKMLPAFEKLNFKEFFGNKAYKPYEGCQRWELDEQGNRRIVSKEFDNNCAAYIQADK